jgi:hypothetical protein
VAETDPLHGAVNGYVGCFVLVRSSSCIGHRKEITSLLR